MSLSVYKASAGSGKTYRMALEMVAILLNRPDEYKHSLAITFTNKAAGELKTRVVFVLDLLSRLDDTKGYLSNIRNLTGFDDEKIRQRSRIALSLILHDYSRFSVSTIDKFFNRILTGFSYEANIRPDSEISLDDKINREEALDEMLSEFRLDDPIGKWLADYSRQKIDDTGQWNIRRSILEESEALTKEDFLQKESSLKKLSGNKSLLSEYRDKLRGILAKHRNVLAGISKKAGEILDNSTYSISDFSNGKNGACGFLLKLKNEPFAEVKKRPREAYDDAESLLSASKRKDASLYDFATGKIHPLLVEAIDYYDKYLEEYNTARIILKTFNDFGVFLDLNTRLRQLSQERNIYFPFQMSQLLHEIVVRENAMFVYEKIGSLYRHYMLDEFQDTSRMQWDILRPLLEEGLAHGGKLLVVGDVKQSIYRWRNSDWSLLDHEVESQFPGGDSLSLNDNFRSRRDIVRFNNHLIRFLLPAFELKMAEKMLPGDNGFEFSHLYSDYRQTPHAKDEPFGFVRYEKVSDEEDKSWKDIALDEMVAEMEKLQSMGYSPGDMAVLTRDNKTAGEIALRLMEADRDSTYHFPVVSASSLELREHPAVQCLLSAMEHIASPDNLLALNQLVFTYHKDVLGDNDFQPHPDFPDRDSVFAALLGEMPQKYRESYKNLGALPLYDLTENLIHWFGMDVRPELYAYLTAFQDQVLIFSDRNSADISAFIEWFDKKSPKLDLPETADAIVISTIHKSKGLQYRFVFMPFLDWQLDKGQPRMWLSPEKEPFNEMPLVMVKYEKDMMQSHFRKNYQSEFYRKLVDSLNLLYVAVTRAEEGLWLWSKEGNNKMSDLSDILNYAMSQAVADPNDSEHFPEKWDEFWNDDKTVFSLGKIDGLKQQGEEKTVPVLLRNYNLNIREHKLRYHHPEAFINLDQDEIIREKTNLGSIAHEILEHCRYADDLEEAVMYPVRSGRIDKIIAGELKARLQDGIDMPEVREWFYGEYEVLNEREILLPDGHLIKPDRVMINGSKAIVVDYKFGKKHNQAYEKQVRTYMDALESIGYRDVFGYIWYVMAGEVVEC